MDSALPTSASLCLLALGNKREVRLARRMPESCRYQSRPTIINTNTNEVNNVRSKST